MRLARPLLFASLLALPVAWLSLSGVATPFWAESHEQHPPLPLLAQLSGRWKGEQTAGGAKLLETVQWKPVLEESFLQCRLEAIDPITGNVTYQGIGFLRHDPSSDGYSFHWFDSNGCTERYVGRAVGETLEFDAVEAQGIDRLVFRADEHGYTRVASRKTEGGSLLTVLESHYRPDLKDRKNQKTKDE